MKLSVGNVSVEADTLTHGGVETVGDQWWPGMRVSLHDQSLATAEDIPTLSLTSLHPVSAMTHTVKQIFDI